MGVKNYTFSGIRVEAMRIIPPMSEDDSAGLLEWIGAHNVTVTVETGYDIGTAILVESGGDPFGYSFYMYPGDWLAYDGDIFFHITDDVFRKHYREITGKKVTDQGDTVVYATGGILDSATGIDKFPPVDGLIDLDKLPPVKVVTGGKVHKQFVDAIRKAQDKAKADATHKKAKDALDAAELKQQAKETNRETYRRHLKLLELEDHADQCTYCKDTTRNTVPPAFNKTLADAVDQMLKNHHTTQTHKPTGHTEKLNTLTDKATTAITDLENYLNEVDSISHAAINNLKARLDNLGRK